VTRSSSLASRPSLRTSTNLNFFWQERTCSTLFFFFFVLLFGKCLLSPQAFLPHNPPTLSGVLLPFGGFLFRLLLPPSLAHSHPIYHCPFRPPLFFFPYLTVCEPTASCSSPHLSTLCSPLLLMLLEPPPVYRGSTLICLFSPLKNPDSSPNPELVWCRRLKSTFRLKPLDPPPPLAPEVRKSAVPASCMDPQSLFSFHSPHQDRNYPLHPFSSLGTFFLKFPTPALSPSPPHSPTRLFRSSSSTTQIFPR